MVAEGGMRSTYVTEDGSGADVAEGSGLGCAATASGSLICRMAYQ